MWGGTSGGVILGERSRREDIDFVLITTNARAIFIKNILFLFSCLLISLFIFFSFS